MSPDQVQPGPGETHLEQRLRTDASRADALAAFKLARRWFVAGRRIEMRDLAAELGVSRATLFRWIGSRDELLGEVLWSLTKPTLARIDEGTPGRGAARIAQMMGRFATVLTEVDYFRQFLRREPERALRVLTTRSGTVQRRVVEAVQDLLLREFGDRGVPSRLPVYDLSYVIVRIIESFVYSDLIINQPPDAAKVQQTVAELLGTPPGSP